MKCLDERRNRNEQTNPTGKERQKRTRRDQQSNINFVNWLEIFRFNARRVCGPKDIATS